MTQAIEKLNIARTALAEAKDIHDILNVRDAAMATAVLADAKGAGEIANQAKEVQLRAERKAGQWLAIREKRPPGPKDKLRCNTTSPDS